MLAVLALVSWSSILGWSIATAPPGHAALPAYGSVVTVAAAISQPRGIATGPDGNLWFTSPGNDTIGRVTPAGVVTSFGGPGIAGPSGIAAGPDGALWFTNATDASIGRITTTGVVSQYLDASISGPDGIAAGSDGNLWFTSSGNDRVGRITPGGTVTTFPLAAGSTPRGIAAGPDGALWFAGNGNATVGRITTAGVTTTWADPGIDHPVGIAAGSDGALWFTNAGNGSIGRVTTAGVVTGFSDPAIATPEGIAAGSDGNLWFTSSGNDRVGRITPGGTVTTFPLAAGSAPRAITAGPDSALWFTNAGSSTVGRVTAGGTMTTIPGPAIGSPWGITVGPDGNLWFTNRGPGAGSIGRITLTGVVTTFTDPTIADPVGIAKGPDGALWFTNHGGNTIGRITTNGAVTGFSHPSINQPWGITAGPDGALWFANNGTTTVGRITTAGAVSAHATYGGVVPRAITVGPDNALWFTGSQYPPATLGRMTVFGVASRSWLGVSATPKDIAAGPDGNVWFTVGNAIGRIAPPGVGAETTFTGPEVSQPEGIARGADGNLWFTNRGNGSIGRITTSGVITTYPGPASGPAGITSAPDGNVWFTGNAAHLVGKAVVDPGIGFHALPAPVRILDSRPPPEQVGPYATPWGPGLMGGRLVRVADVGGVPSGAGAVALNVTVTGTTAASFLALSPSVGGPSTVSNLNWAPGQTIANAVTVKAGADGQIWVQNNAGGANVIIDVVGYYDSAPEGAGFTPVGPARILDSRPPPEQVGPYGTPWTPGVDREVQVAGVGGVPADAVAVVLNATVTGTSAESFLTVYPKGASRPTASNLNWVAGVTIPNAVTVRVGAEGKVRVYNNSGSADVVFDVVGFFEVGTGHPFHALNPIRFQDSRPPPEQVGPDSIPWGPRTERTVSVLTRNAVPATAKAVLTNMTVTSTTAESFLTVWPTGTVRPTASSVNWKAGTTIANSVTARVGVSGSISVYNNSGSVDVIGDAFGWYG